MILFPYISTNMNLLSVTVTFFLFAQPHYRPIKTISLNTYMYLKAILGGIRQMLYFNIRVHTINYLGLKIVLNNDEYHVILCP